MKLERLIGKIEEKYPLNLAYSWDNVGLIVGDLESDIKKVLVVLEANEKVVQEAIQKKVDLIVTHHPFIFGKINKVNTDDLKGKLIHKLIKNGISIYSMHTNFDIAFDGLNDYFMEIMGFDSKQVLEATDVEVLYKVVVYVPNSHISLVRDALGRSGAGYIGNYSHCTFNSQGVGTFKPLEGSNPFLGTLGEVEYTDEVKIETIVAKNNLKNVIDSMLEAHPYEEVAYDIYRLENKGKSYGLGRISCLEKPLTLKQLSNTIKEKFGMKYIRVVGDIDSNIKRLAVVTGSGADMVKVAKKSGAQVIITGDIKYHDAQDAIDMGMNIIDIGHFESEDIFKDVMANFLNNIVDLEIIKSDINLNPFKIM